MSSAALVGVNMPWSPTFADLRAICKLVPKEHRKHLPPLYSAEMRLILLCQGYWTGDAWRLPSKRERAMMGTVKSFAA